MTRRIVANLDVEHRLGGGPALRPPTLALLATLGSLLRVFGRDHDELWGLAPIPPDHVSAVGPRLRYRVGRPPPQSPDTLWWCPEHDVPPNIASGDTPFGWLRSAGASIPDFANRCFVHRLRQELGCDLPGEAWIEQLADLKAALELTPDPFERWVLKAPWSAAGRDRKIGDRSAVLRFAPGVLARNGGALLEPWLERTRDYGAIGQVDTRGVTCHGIHDLRVDGRGTFRGIHSPATISATDRLQLETVFHDVGRALERKNFRGPFGIDAFRYQQRGGPANGGGFCPLIELNPRMTFGHVARAWLDYLGIEQGSLRMASEKLAPAGLDPALVLTRGSVVSWIEPDPRAARSVY